MDSRVDPVVALSIAALTGLQVALLKHFTLKDSLEQK